MNWNDKEFDDLVSKYLEEDISETEMNTLNQLLESDPEYAKRFLELSKIHSSLHELRGVEKEQKEKKPKAKKQRKSRTAKKRKSRPAFAIVFTAAALLVLGLFINFSLKSSHSQPVLRLTELTKNSQLFILNVNGSKTIVQKGAKIEFGKKILCEGEAKLKFDGENTSLVLKNGSSISLYKSGIQKSIELHNGKIICDVTPQEKALELNTGYAKATVLGTRFELVRREEWSELAVFKGKVQWADNSGDSVIVNGGYFSRAGKGIKLDVYDLNERYSNILLSASSGKVVGDGWRNGSSGSMIFETSQNAITNLSLQKEGKLGYLEFKFEADGVKDYFVWVRGRSIGPETGDRDLSNHDMLYIDAPTGKWDLRNWEVSSDWEWAKNYIPSPMFNGFRSNVNDNESYFWIGGPADAGTEDRVPWRFQLRFHKSGEQTIRIYGIEGPMELDRIWISSSQKDRPQGDFRGR